MNAQQITTPSPSQYASAACHMERMSEWRYVRIAGERYAVIPSGVSGHTYLCRADAAGCSCLGYVKTGRRCSHMLSLELAALEQELADEAAHQDALDWLTEMTPTVAPTRYDSLYPACRVCGDLCERDLCDRHASDAAYRERLAGKIGAGVR